MLPSSRASGGGGGGVNSNAKLKKSLDDVLENSFHISTIVPAPEGCSPEQRQIHENRRQKHIAEAEESMLYICRTLHKYLKNGISPLLLREFYQSYLIREGQSKCADKFVEMMRLPKSSESSDVLLQIGDVQLNYEAILQILSAQDATAVVEVQTAITKINDSNVSLIKKQQKKIDYFNDDGFLKWFFYFYIRYPGFASKVNIWNQGVWHVKWAKEGYGYTGAFQRPLSDIDYTFNGPVCDTSHVLDFDPDFLNEIVCVFTIVWRLWLSEQNIATDAPYIKILRENIPSRPWNTFFNKIFVPTNGDRTGNVPIDPENVKKFFEVLLGQCSEEMQDPQKLEQWIEVLTVAGNKIAQHTESVRKCVIKHVLNASGFMHGWTANALGHIKDAMYEDADALRVSAQDFGRLGYDVAGAVGAGVRYGFNAARNAWSRPWSRPSGHRFIKVPDNFGDEEGEEEYEQSGVNTGLGLQVFNPQAPSNVFSPIQNQGSTFTPFPSQNSSSVRTPTAPVNSSFGSVAPPKTSRPTKPGFIINPPIVMCNVTFYLNNDLLHIYKRDVNTVLFDQYGPLQSFVVSYIPDFSQDFYDVIVPNQYGENIQNAPQLTLRQLINLQQPGSKNLNVIIKKKPQQPNTNPFSSVASSNSYDNSASAASGGGGAAAVEKEDLLLDGDFNYEPINIFGQQIIFSEDEKYENISGEKIYELFIAELTLQGMQFNDSSFQQFFQKYNSKQLFDFYHYLIVKKGYAYVSNPNYDFTINENGHIELFVKIVYKEKVQDYLKYDVYENNWTNLHTTTITNKKINEITKKTKKYINGGAYVRKMIEFLWKILFVMETSPHNIALMQQDVGQSANSAGPGGGATTKSKAPALSKMKLDDLKLIAKKNGIEITGKTEKQIYEELQKLKKGGNLIYGGSKTRKHRHNKRTHRVKPRKLMSRQQKYSRRK